MSDILLGLSLAIGLKVLSNTTEEFIGGTKTDKSNAIRKRKREYKLKIARKFEVAEFKFNNKNFENFGRTIKDNRKDCVISAFEFLGIYDNKTADFNRILYNSTIDGRNIETFFQNLFPTNKWIFSTISKNKMEKYIKTKMNIGRVIFCGYTEIVPNKPKKSHVFLIGKTSENTLFLFDPQVCNNLICDLTKDDCIQHIKAKDKYYILKYSGKDGLDSRV
mgnify:CR=1 FL=1